MCSKGMHTMPHAASQAQSAACSQQLPCCTACYKRAMKAPCRHYGDSSIQKPVLLA